MIRAFTGPSGLTRQQSYWAAKQVLSYPYAEVWNSGCAYGIDTLVADLAIIFARSLALYVPGAPHNAALVKRCSAFSGVEVYGCGAANGDVAAAYRRRNKVLVRHADHLVAFVKRPTFYRSGEWMTIGIARRHDVPVSIEVLPGGDK